MGSSSVCLLCIGYGFCCTLTASVSCVASARSFATDLEIKGFVVKLTNQEIEFLLHRYGDQIKSRAQVCAGGNFRKSDVREIETVAKRIQEMLRAIVWHHEPKSE